MVKTNLQYKLLRNKTLSCASERVINIPSDSLVIELELGGSFKPDYFVMTLGPRKYKSTIDLVVIIPTIYLNEVNRPSFDLYKNEKLVYEINNAESFIFNPTNTFPSLPEIYPESAVMVKDYKNIKDNVILNEITGKRTDEKLDNIYKETVEAFRGTNKSLKEINDILKPFIDEIKKRILDLEEFKIMTKSNFNNVKEFSERLIEEMNAIKQEMKL